MSLCRHIAWLRWGMVAGCALALGCRNAHHDAAPSAATQPALAAAPAMAEAATSTPHPGPASGSLSPVAAGVRANSRGPKQTPPSAVKPDHTAPSENIAAQPSVIAPSAAAPSVQRAVTPTAAGPRDTIALPTPPATANSPRDARSLHLLSVSPPAIASTPKSRQGLSLHLLSGGLADSALPKTAEDSSLDPLPGATAANKSTPKSRDTLSLNIPPDAVAGRSPSLAELRLNPPALHPDRSAASGRVRFWDRLDAGAAPAAQQVSPASAVVLPLASLDLSTAKVLIAPYSGLLAVLVPSDAIRALAARRWYAIPLPVSGSEHWKDQQSAQHTAETNADRAARENLHRAFYRVLLGSDEKGR